MAGAVKTRSSETRNVRGEHALYQCDEAEQQQLKSTPLFGKRNVTRSGRARDGNTRDVLGVYASSQHGEKRRERYESTIPLGDEDAAWRENTRDKDGPGSESDLAISKSNDEELLSRAAIHAAVEDWLDYEGSMLEDASPAAVAERPVLGLPGAGEAKRAFKREAGGSSVPCSPPPCSGGSNNGRYTAEPLDQPGISRSPTKQNPASTPRRAATLEKGDGVSARQTRKDFEATKRDTAAAFFKELDDTITGGRLAALAASTGGVKLNWNNKLNTTAGRANWKRETVRGAAADQADVQHRHHASIDISEKVIDSEHRLLNVIAHEFCHLANFMISGITGSPHGKEFKAWASKCSAAFSGRGIEVTTKHSYDIDFKYVWRCSDCMLEYKRHSKSIDPGRHRCGACTGTLQQTKPTPRAGAPGKASKYQTFVREQMKIVRADNPKVPQREIMRLVAEKWAASAKKGGEDGEAEPSDAALRDVTDQLNTLGLRNGVRSL